MAPIYPYTEIKKENGFISLSCDGTQSVNLGGWSEIGIYSQLGHRAKIGDSVHISDDTFIGVGVLISDGIKLEYDNGNLNFGGFTLSPDGHGAYIAADGSDFTLYYGWLNGPIQEGNYYGKTTINAEFGYIKFESSEGNKSIEITDDGLRISKGESTSIIGKNVTIPDNLSFSIADNILTITDGTNTWKLTAES